MKIFIAHIIVLSLGIAVHADHRICNSDLLYSYGVRNPQYTSQTSLLCQTLEPESCCSNNDESSMLDQWNNRDKLYIKPYYQGIAWLMEGIFQYYEDVIYKAKFMYINQSYEGQCRLDAEFLILNYMTKKEIQDFISDLKDLFDDLGHIRKGFYCGLCSVRNQKFFDLETKKLVFSYTFCRDLVQSSIETVMMRTAKILPIFSRMNSFANCSAGEKAKDALSFIPNDLLYEQVKDCFNAVNQLKEPELWIDKCVGYCSEFSIAEATELFEGVFGPLESLFTKLRNIFKQASDPVNNQLDTTKNYNFSKIKGGFYEPMLSFQDLTQFKPLFEKYGIDLKKEADISLFFYGNDSDLEIYEGVSRLNLFALFLLFWILFK